MDPQKSSWKCLNIVIKFAKYSNCQQNIKTYNNTRWNPDSYVKKLQLQKLWMEWTRCSLESKKSNPWRWVKMAFEISPWLPRRPLYHDVVIKAIQLLEYPILPPACLPVRHAKGVTFLSHLLLLLITMHCTDFCF